MTPDHLFRYAAQGEMIPAAPVQASARITIDASVTDVWAIMTDVARWPSWHPYLKNAELDGGFVPGSALQYGGLIKHRLTVAAVEPRIMAVLCGRMLIYDGITRWDLSAIHNRTEVTFTESSSGFLLGALYSEKALREHLRQWLVALKEEAEREATEH